MLCKKSLFSHYFESVIGDHFGQQNLMAYLTPKYYPPVFEGIDHTQYPSSVAVVGIAEVGVADYTVAVTYDCRVAESDNADYAVVVAAVDYTAMVAVVYYDVAGAADYAAVVAVVDCTVVV